MIAVTDNVVTPLFVKPDEARMLQHLRLLFGRAMTGRIEVTAIHTDKEAGHRPRTRFFDVGELEEAAEHAASLNAEPGWNTYVGAALRRDETFPGQAADDSDFLRAYAVWADADDQAQVDAAREAYRALKIDPPFVVVTGRTPSTRAQLWWPLETPVDDIDTLRATLRGIAAVLKTDPKVCTGKQLMRLAGGVNWPKKADRIVERTEVSEPARARREFTLEHLHAAFPPLTRLEAAATSIPAIEVAPAGALGLDERVMDGRELYAFNLVRAHLHEFMGLNGAAPSPDELYRAVWPVYARKVDLARAGRGPEFLMRKCAEAIRAFAAGQIPFMRTLDEAVSSYVEKAREGRTETDPPPFEPAEGRAGAPDPDIFQALTIGDIKLLPDAEWLLKDAIPKTGLGFIYAAPASYKSFVCIDLGLSIAYGMPAWMDRELKDGGRVVYLASEGVAGIKNRITAWQLKRGVEQDSDRFLLIPKAMSFMDVKDVDKLERTVAQIVADRGAVGVIFVDTVSRVLPGADENLQKDMTIFVQACDRLRERFGAVVIGVHHTNKSGDMRGSTIFLGQGDFIFRIDKDETRNGGVLACEKQKDAESGWKMEFAAETMSWIPTGRLEAVASLVVNFTGPPGAPKHGDDDWPSRDTCKSIQTTIDVAWKAGRPLSPYPQTQREGRYAIRVISRRHELTAKVATMVIERWQETGLIELRELDRHSKIKGLMVREWLD